jgi:MFS family permease
VASVSTFLRSLKGCPAFLAFLFSATLIGSICLAFVPCWERNDDVAMSMVAHGYGLATYGSPHLIFSNVLWGYLVRAIPTINGVLGYSLAAMTVLLVFGWATLYFLIRLGVGYLLGFLTVTLLIALPTLVPQFTVNAGLLTVAAIIGWQVYARLGGVGILVTACLLAFFGYLIRSLEFLLVLGVALPLLPWRALREQRQMQIAFLLLAVAMASASAFDRWSYSGPEWQHFEEFNLARLPYTDYGAGEHIKQHPEILARHGYSSNDMDLMANWFFVDPRIANPKSLNAMLAELGPLPMLQGNVQFGFAAIKVFFNTKFLPFWLSGLILLVLMPRWSVALAWMFCLAVLFIIGVMGRTGVVRIYIPLMNLLFIAPLVGGKYSTAARQWLTKLTLILACAGITYQVVQMGLVSRQRIQQVQRDIQGLPAETFVSFGSREFPYRFAFPVMANDLKSRNIRLYGLNSFSNAPFSVANAEQTAGSGMLERLQTTTGIPIFASPKKLEILRIYCSEHLNGQLRGFVAYQTQTLTVNQVRCEVDK